MRVLVNMLCFFVHVVKVKSVTRHHKTENASGDFSGIKTIAGVQLLEGETRKLL